MAPERMCAVCRKKGDKNSFIRVVKQKEGQIIIDASYKLNGRGVYICNNQDCVSKAIKSKAINRSFKTEIGAEIYEDLRNYYESK